MRRFCRLPAESIQYSWIFGGCVFGGFLGKSGSNADKKRKLKVWVGLRFSIVSVICHDILVFHHVRSDELLGLLSVIERQIKEWFHSRIFAKFKC